MTRQLTEVDKNDLVVKYERIVNYTAKRFHFLDDKEEVKGWCLLGLAEAISKFEQGEKKKLEYLVFDETRKALLSHYKRKKKPQSSVNLQSKIYEAKNGEELSLEETLEAEEEHYKESDILELLTEALFEFHDTDKKIITKHLIYDKSYQELRETYGCTESKIRKIIKRGIDAIKLYLSNNDIISDYLLFPKNETGTIKQVQHKVIPEKDYGKIKYIKKHYPHLGYSDIAKLIGSSPFAVATFLDYPTVKYISAGADDSIAEDVLQYCKENYPEKIPGKVKVYSLV